MTNHVRTLLLNESAGIDSVVVPAERYVPPDYRRRAVPAAARPVYDALFPPGCDRTFKNFRLAQLLPLLHQPVFEPLTLSFDPRVTYLPFDRTAFDALLTGTVVINLVGTAVLAVERMAAAVDPTRLLSSWRVDVVDATHVRLLGYAGAGTDGGGTVSFSATAGLSDPIQLPGTAYAIRVPTAAVGSAWQVTVLADPPPIAEAAAAADRFDCSALFSTGAALATAAGEVWNESPHLLDRLAAAALGVAGLIDATTPGGGE